jgi:hypothetical protein
MNKFMYDLYACKNNMGPVGWKQSVFSLQVTFLCVQKVKKFKLTGSMCIETGMVYADLFGANSCLVCEVQLISKTSFTHQTGKVLCDDRTLKYMTSNQRILISTHTACKHTYKT